MSEDTDIDSLTIALQQMKGIDLPAAVSPWPPAPGWWGLLVILLLAGAALARRRWRQRALRRAAMATAERLYSDYRRHRDQTELVKGLSILLRRTALARHPRQRVAGLEGDAWLAFLDQTGGAPGAGFRDGPGRVLTTLPYGADEAADVENLMALVRRWIRHNT